jgi:hypothetical protein
MSRACAAELDDLCRDASCECHCHDCDGLEPFDVDESEGVTWLSADDRARRREATR